MAVPLAAVATVVALRPAILRGTFSSPASVLRVAALIAAWIGFSWLVRRVVHHSVARTAIVATAGLAVLAVTVFPYFRDKEVDDALPQAAVSAPAAAAPGEVAPIPAGPQKVASGHLRGLAGHRASGEAVLYRQPDGSLLVRLEDFDVSSVPAPVVYLIPGAGRESPGGAKLGGLRGNQGNLNIPVPAGLEASGPQTLLIWCEAFSVPVAAATQAPL